MSKIKNEFYCYLPIREKLKYEDIEWVVSEVCERRVRLEERPDAIARNFDYHWLNVEVKNSLTKVNLLNNRSFASDPRLFIRLRISPSQIALIETLINAARLQKGYYGYSSKVFKNYNGKTVFNVTDDEDSVILSYGEIIDELEDCGWQWESEVRPSSENLVTAYFENLKLTITPLGNGQYSKPIPKQITCNCPL